MSVWTHIVGSISCDVMGVLFSDEETPAEVLARVTGHWYDEYLNTDKMWPDSLEGYSDYGDGPEMPEGSEGPMHFASFNLGSKSSINNGLVSFWGNLRDYGEADVKQDMLPWFENLVKRYKESGIGIRNMAIQIEIEYGPRYMLTYTNNKLEISESLAYDQTNLQKSEIQTNQDEVGNA